VNRATTGLTRTGLAHGFLHALAVFDKPVVTGAAISVGTTLLRCDFVYVSDVIAAAA